MKTELEYIAEAKDKYDTSPESYKQVFNQGVVGFLLDHYRVAGEEARSELIRLFGDIAMAKEDDQQSNTAKKVEAALITILPWEKGMQKNFKTLANDDSLQACNKYATELLERAKLTPSTAQSSAMFK